MIILHLVLVKGCRDRMLSAFTMWHPAVFSDLGEQIIPYRCVKASRSLAYMTRHDSIASNIATYVLLISNWLYVHVLKYCIADMNKSLLISFDNVLLEMFPSYLAACGNSMSVWSALLIMESDFQFLASIHSSSSPDSQFDRSLLHIDRYRGRILLFLYYNRLVQTISLVLSIVCMCALIFMFCGHQVVKLIVPNWCSINLFTDSPFEFDHYADIPWWTILCFSHIAIDSNHIWSWMDIYFV